MTTVNRLPRSTPEEQGVSSAAILAFVEGVESKNIELHSFMLLRHGNVIAEGWWSPYRPELPHVMFSLSKSFTSTGVGLAVAEGRLSVDDRVLSFFPGDAPATVSKNLDAMQVRHLLSMSTGHDTDTFPVMAERQDGEWTKAFLAHPVIHEPGTHFLYNTGATYMLSAIVQKLTGMTLLEYLKPRLFDPLGITDPTWGLSPEGISIGGIGLNIRTEDIARFGQMYLQKGRWNGKQLVPETWIAEASSKQSDNGGADRINEPPEWRQGYGYQFWLCRHNAYRGDGAFGQYCIVMPEQDAVLAITGGHFDMQGLMNQVWDHLLPALSQPTPLPPQPELQKKLTQKLVSLDYLPSKGKSSSPLAASLSGKTFAIEPETTIGARPSGATLNTIVFDFTEKGSTITVHNQKGDHCLMCGVGVWREGMFTLFDPFPREVASGVWTDDNTFVLTLRLIETAFVHTLTFHFTEDRLTVDGKLNVAFGPTSYSFSGQVQK